MSTAHLQQQLHILPLAEQAQVGEERGAAFTGSMGLSSLGLSQRQAQLCLPPGT